MGATQGRVGLFSLGTWLLASLIVVDAVWAEGEVSFIAAPEVGVGRNPLSIAVGDFNGDGQPDLATANIGDGAASILLGGGDGTFQASPDVVVGAGPTSIAVGDFNDDGRLDLATANISVNNVSIRLGQGDGTFRVAPDVGVGASPQSIAVGDFNRDGRPDLATANGTFPEPGGGAHCGYSIDPAGAGRRHFPGGPRGWSGGGSSVHHGGRFQWRHPARCGHSQCR
jgi:hypothetical protein